MLWTHFTEVNQLHALIEYTFSVASLQKNSFVTILNFGYLGPKIFYIRQIFHYLAVEES